MKKFSKTLFILLGGILLCSCGGTPKEEITLKLVEKYEGEYEVGFPIDVETFFYCSKHGEGEIKVKYIDENGEQVEETLKGTTFIPKNSGTFNFSYSIDGKSISCPVEVVDVKPLLNIDNYAYFAEVNEKTYFEDIYAIISPTYSPQSAVLEPKKVEYAPFNINLENVPQQYREVPISSNKKYFDGSQPGNYRIHVSVRNGTRSVDGVINATLASNLQDGNENVYRYNNKYASKKLVCSPTNKNLYMLSASRFNDAGYVVLDELFENNDCISIKFKGKNLPTFGLLAEPSKNGTFGPKAIEGYYLTFEQYVRNGEEKPVYGVWNSSESKWVKMSVTQRNEDFGILDLDDDKYYYVTAGLAINEYSINGNLDHLHLVYWDISEIVDYGTENEHYETIRKVYSSGGWWDNTNKERGRMILYSSSLQDIVFEVCPNKDKENNISVHGGFRVSGNDLTYKFFDTNYSGNGKDGYVGDTRGYVKHHGEFTTGTTVSYAFHGKNMPSVALFTDHKVTNITGGTGMLLSPGTKDPNLNKWMTFYGPYKFLSENPQDYLPWVSYDPETGEPIYKDASASWMFRFGDDRGQNDLPADKKGLGSPFSLTNLDRDADYLYEIKMVSVTKEEIDLNLTLYKMNEEGEYILDYSHTYQIRIPSEYQNIMSLSGDIIAYPRFFTALAVNTYTDAYNGRFSGNKPLSNYTPSDADIGKYFIVDNDETNFYIRTFYQWTGTEFDCVGDSFTTFTTYPINHSPVLDNDIVTYNALCEDNEIFIEGCGTGDIYKLSNVNYVGVKSAASVGNTIKVNFTGKNIPNVCFLADCHDGQAVGGGQGVYLATSFMQAEHSTIGADDNQRKVMPYGPYRWSSLASRADGKDTFTYYRYNEWGTMNKGYGYLEADDNTDYEYRISIDSLVEGVIKFTISIKDVTNDTLLDSRTMTLDLASHLNNGDIFSLKDNLIFYGQGRDIHFTYEIL